ncbi:dihydroxyacetone kinase subunit DhaL [Aestuariimicrobium soli]|uniref:dihydroxyacetone kinase subunit DhaL n=1 Tax=Aestuariimicrobium soli TaxID=2035834 RepID=UPI003EBAD17D
MTDTAAIAAWLADFAGLVSENASLLTDLDRQIGDADHGSNMERGMTAVAALDPESFADPSALLKAAGMTLVSTVGGASGPLFGTFFLRFATAVDGTDLTPTQIAEGLEAGLAGVVARGKAAEGDKTMIDSLAPAVRACQEAIGRGASLAEALREAADAAAAGRDATEQLVAHKGRASYLGERSKGVQDPGATSVALLIESAARTLA